MKEFSDKLSIDLMTSSSDLIHPPLSYMVNENCDLSIIDNFLEAISSLSQMKGRSELVEQILTICIKFTEAKCGCIFLKTQKGKIEKLLAKDRTGKKITDDDFYISLDLIKKISIKRQVEVIDEPYSLNEIHNNTGRQVLCIPLYRRNCFIGYVCLSKGKSFNTFSEYAVKISQIFSAQASILLENAFLSQNYKQLNNDMDTKVKQQMNDITEKNRQIEKMNIMFCESEKMKDVLNGTLVHDIKNYAAGIEGNLQYLNRILSDDKKVHRILDVVSETCTDIFSIASNMLDITKMSQGKMILHLETISPEYIECIAEKYLKSPLFNEKEITPAIVHCNEPFSIEIDTYLLDRIFQNVFSNSAKFANKNGCVEMSIKKTEKEVIISIFNSGNPIPEDEKDLNFEKFARLDNHQLKYTKGLSLFFCKMAMEAHKGRIWIETIETGNYFKLAFPLSILKFED